MDENPLPGSYDVDELTGLVEAEVLAEFDRISERGGVLGAMSAGRQRGRIQGESMLYEQRKHDGTLPIVDESVFAALMAPPGCARSDRSPRRSSRWVDSIGGTSDP